jgi:hypothetical protein
MAACTTGNAWPVVDTLWTGYFLLNLAVVANSSNEELRMKNLDRGTAVGVNVALAALAVTSAVVGYSRVNECQEQVASAGRGGYSSPRLIAPPRSTRRQEEAEEEAAVQAQMRARSAKAAEAAETGEDAPAVTPTPPAPAVTPPPPAPAAPQSPPAP